MPPKRKDQLRELLDSSPDLFTNRVNREAWQHLVRWYREKEEVDLPRFGRHVSVTQLQSLLV